MKTDFYNQEKEFVPIKGYEHEYSIHKTGLILSMLTDQLVKTSVDSKGYLTVNLYKDGKRKTKRVHILVAETFIPNPDNLPVVNHIDGNKQNPHVSNLEWTSYSENTLHAHRTGLITKTSDKAVIRGDGRVYASITQAAIENHITKSAISKVINGTRRTAGGHTWALKGGENNA